jgi:antirestriction protein
MTMTATPETRTEPAAWVGCLSCYNDGNLVGKWLTDPDEIRSYRCPKPVTVYSSHEELWVFDHENLPFIKGECSPSEFADLAEKWAAALDEIDADPDIVLAYIDNVGVDYIEWDTLAEDFAESYAGEFEDLADYAYRLADDCGELPEGPYANYIDWEAVGRDYRLGGDVWTHEVGYKSMHIFRNT